MVEGTVSIWVVEQLDPSGILYSCIACCDEQQAKACQESFEQNLSPAQTRSGWMVTFRMVYSWNDVPVSALKLN
jgi:hypothetical protein